MKHKTTELRDQFLDYFVAKGLATIDSVFAAKFENPLIVDGFCIVGHGHISNEEFARYWCNAPDYAIHRMRFMPSVRWEEGGPIIKRELISVQHGVEGYTDPEEPWYSDCGVFWDTGPTPLIAAMRAFVASKFGTEVEMS